MFTFLTISAANAGGLATWLGIMDAYLKDLEAKLTISKAEFKDLTAIFQKELEIGLRINDGMLKDLPTFVYNLPEGSETGKYLTVDLGGTNLRIGLVELLGSGEFTIKKDSVAIPEALKCGSGRDIFGFIAENIEKFLEHPEIEAELPLKLGFTFSFPVQQDSLAHGRILGWSKEIEARDVIGQDAVALLQEALHSRGLDIDVEALINDTVGTLLAQIYRDPRTKMSVILGTGSNAAYVEKSSNVTKTTNHSSDSTVINIEWGSFGDDGKSSKDFDLLPSTKFDLQLDSESKNPGLQRFEKMISGMYLGEIFRLIVVDLSEKDLILLSSESETRPYAIKTKEMSKFHELFLQENYEKCQEIAETKFGLSRVSREIVVLLSRICELISLRSCYLCAVGITAIHRHLMQSGAILPDQLFSVALDGALYQKYPNYSTILQNLVCEVGDSSGEDVCRVVLVMAEDLSSIGAAAAIAAQTKSAKSK